MMTDILKALALGLLIVSFAIFAITFYYSIFIILFFVLAVTMGYIIVIARKEIEKEKQKNSNH